MTNEIVVKAGKYEIVRKPTDEEGKYVVRGGGKPYVVTVRENWRGARCSCPQGIFRSRRNGTQCKHEKMVREAMVTVAQIRGMNPTVSIKF